MREALSSLAVPSVDAGCGLDFARVRILVVLSCFVMLRVADAQRALPQYEVGKAQLLLRTQLPCLGCHELDGDGGTIAPSLSTVRVRRSAAYIRAIIEDPQKTLPGAAMPRHAMPPAVRELIVRFLANGAKGAEGPAITAPPVATLPIKGAVLYAKWCASCHGATGNGDGPNWKRLPVAPAKHADPRVMGTRADDALFDLIAVGGVPYGRSARMPAFGATLSPVEIRALVSHIRTLCNCQGPAWSRQGAGQ